MNDRVRRLLAAALLGLAGVGAQASTLVVEGSEFVVHEVNGATRRSADLIGEQLQLPGGIELRIDAVRPETSPAGDAVWLHELSTRVPGGEWHSACEPDPDGHRLALPLPGTFDAVGTYRPDAAKISLTCTSGARGKCVRFGYAPWRTSADGRPLLDHYNACMRMVRADYCGDGVAHTVNGTRIDLYDRLGIQKSEGGDGFAFEAGWGPQGAVCVRHPRIVAQGTLADLAASCPRLAAAPLGDDCSEDAAAERGAVLFNQSR